MKKIIVLLLGIALIGMIGCQDKGPIQPAGERTDEIIDNVKHEDAPLKEKGALEKAGKSVDETLKKE